MANTVRDVLNKMSVNYGLDAFRQGGVKVGDLLYSLSTRETETFTSDGDTQTLAKGPIPHTVSVTCNGVVKTYQNSGTIAAGSFKLSGTGFKTVTFKSGEGLQPIVVTYQSYDQSTDTDGNTVSCIPTTALATTMPNV